MKIIRILLFLLAVQVCNKSFSQDLIIMKNGDEVKAKILEILPDVVKYKKAENLDGPSYSEIKNNIFMIKYQNGTKDVFNQQSISNVKNTVSNEDIKKDKAIKELEEYMANLIKSKKVKVFNFKGFKKTNGVMRDYFGQSVYEIEFEITLQFVVDAWMKGNGAEGYWRNDFGVWLTKPTLSGAETMMYDTKYFQRGLTVIVGCKTNLENSDNGYQLKKHEIETIKNLGIQPLDNNYNPDQATSKKETPIINNLVDYKIFKGYLISDPLKANIRISNIRINDELNNISETKKIILESFQQMRRLEYKNIYGSLLFNDTLSFEIIANFSYRNYSSNGSLVHFADCMLEIKLINETLPSMTKQNIYKLSNYSLLSKGFSSPIEANRNLLAENFNQTLSQFIIGNFPLQGEIIEVVEKNSKQTEAKIVKIDAGRRDGIFNGYSFFITNKGSQSNKADIVVKETFEDYSLCKVIENEKLILENYQLGKKLYVKTIYSPK